MAMMILCILCLFELLLGGLGDNSKFICNTIARYFHVKNTDSTNCPRETWLEKFRDADPTSDKNIINIGFNKGYNFALFLSLWTDTTVDVKMWYDSLVEIGISDCGACYDCKARVLQLSGHQSNNSARLNIVGVDIQHGSVQNARLIINKFQTTIPSWNRSVNIHTIHAAGSNRVGNIWVHRCGNSGDSETCSVVSEDDLRKRSAEEISAEFDSIPVITVDGLIADLIKNKSLNTRHHIRHKGSISSLNSNSSHFKVSRSLSTIHGHGVVIDILMIDTEGSDARVIQGAKRALHSKSIRMLVFEYHMFCPWAETSLEEVVNTLADYNYDCYFEGNERVWKLTDCWDPLWEIRYWSNVLCLRRGDIWHQIIEKDFVVSFKDAVSGMVNASSTGEEFKPRTNDQFPCSTSNNEE